MIKLENQIRALLVAFAFSLLLVPVGDAKTRKKIIYKKKTSVDFSDAVIQGRGNNPEGIYVVTPPKRKFKGLLRLRTNFHKELIRDSLLLK